MHPPSPDSSQPDLKANTFEAIPRRKKIIFFKIGKLWAFKHFFNDKEISRPSRSPIMRINSDSSSRLSEKGTKP